MDASKRLELEVSFGSFSCGDQTARLRFHVERSRMNLEQADAYLCGARLDVALLACQKGDAPGQQHLEGTADTIQSVADCKQYSVKPEEFSAGLTFAKTAELVSELSQLAKRPGKIYIQRIGDTGHGEGFDDDDEIDGELTHPDVLIGRDRPAGTPALQAAAIEHKRRELDAGYRHKVEDLTKSKLKAIARNARTTYDGQGITDSKAEAISHGLEVTSIAALEKVIATDPFWHKRCSGVGEAAIDQLTDALVLFRLCHPVPTDEDFQAASQAEPKPGDGIAAAFRAGCEARMRNENRNPYLAGSDEADQWVRGWEETGEDAESNQSGTMFDSDDVEELDPAEVGSEEVDG